MKVRYLDLTRAYQELEPNLSATIARVLASGRYLLGPELEAFERESSNQIVTALARSANTAPEGTGKVDAKLIDAAYSSGDVGTVTPLSNHATLCSVPRPFEENLLPGGFDVAARFVARWVERI